MSLSKRYDPRMAEPRLQAFWESSGVYRFSVGVPGPVYSIDTPPATVSGHLHLGHAYSFGQTDFLARFWRMNGHNVFYPMGYDDNGLPTGRYVEKQLGIRADEVGRQRFVEACTVESARAEREYEALWRRLGLSVDWRYTYRTIDVRARRISQLSFLDLYDKGYVYRQRSPTIWCPECGTAIAQADLADLERRSTFYTLGFRLADGGELPIATTRPELLPACVAVFVHPSDGRYSRLAGQQVTVPLFGQDVPLLRDHGVDPDKGTGAVMCCTFGDVTDVEWWRRHSLRLVAIVGRDGCMTAEAGDLAGLSLADARQEVVRRLSERGCIIDQQPLGQTVRVHERCDTPAEYVVTQQWFVRLLDFRDRLLRAGEQLIWHPPNMKARYTQWVENLSWDWCISRQRPFGVSFPVWYCLACGEVMLAEASQLPVDPSLDAPKKPCRCGSTAHQPEEDVMDTWATSSLSPQIGGHWPPGEEQEGLDGLYEQVFPMSLRPQAHEIIRTWAFYTITKSLYHMDTLPWKELAISGWGVAGDGMGKISKSRGGGPLAPLDMIERYSADAVRYWAASTGLGKDAVISEEKIQAGAKLVNKLWNVARFSERFLQGYVTPEAWGQAGPCSAVSEEDALSPADRWMLSRSQRLIRRVTAMLKGYEHAAAKHEVEGFFWSELADNYLEMAKLRLYDEADPGREGARYALYHALLTVIKLFAPFLPHVTEEIYQGVFAATEGDRSIHIAAWPVADPGWEDDAAEAAGDLLVEVATAVRRYKSEHSLSLSAELARLHLATGDQELREVLQGAEVDLVSVTRARQVTIGHRPLPGLEQVLANGSVAVSIAR